MDCFRANRGLDNTVNDVLTPLMDWSFEGGEGEGHGSKTETNGLNHFVKHSKNSTCVHPLYIRM